MGFIDEIKARAKACKKTIVLPETEDERTYKAAETVLKEGLADLVLVGSKEEIEKNKGTYDISGATIVDPATDARTEGYIAKLVELRQKKGMTPEQAKELLLSNYLYYGVMMVKMGDADGMVSGACHSTADTLRPCLQILKTKPGTKLVSAFFLMVVPNCDMGANGTFIFADAGLSCMITGHTHVHDISVVTTKKGNKFYDVACGAFIGCPPAMRNITFDPKNAKIDVDTAYIDEVKEIDTKGKSFPDYMMNFFFGMIKEVLWAMGNDIDRLAEMTPAFSVPGETVKKFAWIIKPVGKFLNRLTFKKIWRLCKKESGLKKADIADIADNKVVDFILELVQNLYCGDSPYTPDTKEYKLICGILNIIDSFLNTIHLSIGKFLKGATSVRGLVEPLLWNPGYCDAEATLPLYPIYDDENPAPKEIFDEKEFKDPVKKSKKGPLVLLILILLVVLILAVAVGLIALVVWAVIAIIHAISGTAMLGLLFS